MKESLKRQLEGCIDRLKRGELSEADLREVIESIGSAPEKHQDLLYLQTGNSSVASQALGIAMVREGQLVDLPADPKDWPYKSPLEAIRDGWRVISFPNLALLMDENNPSGLGCEFILEKWS